MTAYSRSSYLVVPLTLIGLFASGAVYGAKVTTSMNVTPSVLYTDNICLSGENKKDDWVARVTPGGNLSIRGKRANLSLGGSVAVNSLSNSQLENRGCSGGTFDNREQYDPNIRASGSVNVIRNRLRVAFGARADQNAFNSRLAGIEDRLDRTGNSNNYLRYNISPTFTNRVGSFSTLKLGYGYDVLLNEKNKANDSVVQKLNLSLKSRGKSQISWGISGSHREIEYTNDDPGVLQRRKTDRQSARLLAGYRFGSRLSLNGTYGYDFNNLKTKNKYDQNGNAWSLGLRWTPNRRTSVSVGSGDRFFGKTPTLKVNYRRQRNSFNLGYDKRITYDRDIRTQTGGNLDDLGGQSLQSRNPIIDERLTLGYNFDGHNIDVNVSGYHSDQTRTIDNSEGTFINLNLNVTPVVSSRFSISYYVNWYRDEPRARFGLDDNRDFSDTWSAGISYNRPINNRLNFGLLYQFTDRSSQQDFGDYQENRVEARLSIAL